VSCRPTSCSDPHPPTARPPPPGAAAARWSQGLHVLQARPGGLLGEAAPSCSDSHPGPSSGPGAPRQAAPKRCPGTHRLGGGIWPSPGAAVAPVGPAATRTAPRPAPRSISRQEGPARSAPGAASSGLPHQDPRWIVDARRHVLQRLATLEPEGAALAGSCIFAWTGPPPWGQAGPSLRSVGAERAPVHPPVKAPPCRTLPRQHAVRGRSDGRLYVECLFIPGSARGRA
jgi:hypothetical protein